MNWDNGAIAGSADAPGHKGWIPLTTFRYMPYDQDRVHGITISRTIDYTSGRLLMMQSDATRVAEVRIDVIEEGKASPEITVRLTGSVFVDSRRVIGQEEEWVLVADNLATGNAAAVTPHTAPASFWKTVADLFKAN
jgi:hypothetical protein